jgi:hypothetical protein
MLPYDKSHIIFIESTNRMDSSIPLVQPTSSPSWAPWIVALFILLLVGGTAYYFYYGRPTVPLPAAKSGFADSGSADASGNKQGFQDASGTEGFQDSGTDASGTSGFNTSSGLPGNPQEAVAQVQQMLQQLGGMGRMDGQAMMKNKENPKAIPPTNVSEGFGGAAHLAPGAPDCSRTSAEGAALIAMFNKPSRTGDGSDDLRELITLVGKLSCFKKDLVSPSHIVDATRRQEFVTAHDIEPIAETTGRCFAKTISPRDLQLSFDKWMTRGEELVARNCTSFGLTSKDYDKAQTLFQKLLRDVADIARGSCLAGEPSIAGKPGPRDPHPYADPSLAEFGEYKGYY